MRILVTNDDGYDALGLRVLVEILRPFGEITVVAPKYHQSGMSMAVTLGYKPIAVKQLSCKAGERWYYLDGTPASCVKFAYGRLFDEGQAPDLVVSGINHGGNYATAALYSGTLGAAMEGGLLCIPSIAVSIDKLQPEEKDFDVVRKFFPKIIRHMSQLPPYRFGMVYNINFPAVKPSEMKGIRVTRPGVMRWVRELVPFEEQTYRQLYPEPSHRGMPNNPVLEAGETLYAMSGEIVLDPANDENCDIAQIAKGYTTVCAINLDNCDLVQQQKLIDSGIENL